MGWVPSRLVVERSRTMTVTLAPGMPPGRCNYISNGVDRKDVVTLMKEQIKRFEGQPDVTGRA